MPTHMKAVIVMLALLVSSIAPQSFAVIDGFVHDFSATLHSVHVTTPDSTSAMAPAQQKETTGIVVDALKALGFLSENTK